MSYWQTLGIDKTTDLAAIKRAYAAKLKITKPDEDPEGFKRLHAAYKQAVQNAKSNARPDQVAESADDPLPLNLKVADDEQGAVTEQMLRSDSVVSHIMVGSPITPSYHGEAEVDAYRRELIEIANTYRAEDATFLQCQWLELTSRIDEVTNDMATMNTLAAWDFLNDRDALLDLEFKSEISHYTFGRIADLINAVRPFLKNEVFDFLDSLFLWRDRRDLLEKEFGHATVEAVMLAIPVIRKGRFRWGYLRRVLATVLKLILFGYFTVMLSKGLSILVLFPIVVIFVIWALLSERLRR
jgi:hypothetical protein